MHILLVNTNPVVSRLLSLNARDNEDIRIDEVDSFGDLQRKRYDVAFIDEKCCDMGEIAKILKRIKSRKNILLSTEKESPVEGIDRIVSKPFLPSEITHLLQEMMLEMVDGEETEDENIEDEEAGDSEKTVNEEAVNEDGDLIFGEESSPILDTEEIEKIKLLLEEDEPKMDDRKKKDMITESPKPAANEKKKAKKKKRKKKMKSKKKEEKIDEKLLAAVLEMKPKKIRKLLEGAEVSITVKFPEEA